MRGTLNALVAILCAIQPLAGGEATALGHLVVVGGGTTNPEIMKEMLGLGGGAEASVVVLAQASQLPDAAAKSIAMWRGLGVANVTSLDDLHAAGARATIGKAGVIWMPGGDQNRLATAIHEAGLAELIRSRHRAGAVVGGTSAGAAVFSQLMMTGKADLQSITAGATKFAEGLGLWPEVIVDQHFVKRQRYARLLSAVLDHPEKIGVGIDEETAVIVSADGWKIIGNSSVLVIDARDAKRVESKPGEIASAIGLHVHLLKAGMTWKPSAAP